MATVQTNKAQLVRDILKKDPNASPVGVAKKLEAHGVSANYVSKIKHDLGKAAAGNSPAKKAPAKPAAAKKPTAKPATRKRAAKTAASSDRVSLGDLIKAKKLAAELGGVENAKAMLDAVSKLS